MLTDLGGIPSVAFDYRFKGLLHVEGSPIAIQLICLPLQVLLPKTRFCLGVFSALDTRVCGIVYLQVDLLYHISVGNTDCFDTFS